MVYLGLNLLRVFHLFTHSYVLIKDGYDRCAESEARLPGDVEGYQSDCPPSVLNHVIDTCPQNFLSPDSYGASAFTFLFL